MKIDLPTPTFASTKDGKEFNSAEAVKADAIKAQAVAVQRIEEKRDHYDANAIKKGK